MFLIIFDVHTKNKLKDCDSNFEVSTCQDSNCHWNSCLFNSWSWL